MGELAQLPNIGPVVEKQLQDAGVPTVAALRALGAEEAWLRIQAMDDSACIHRLLGLEGAVCGVRKADLPPARKEALRAFYRAHAK
jgi:DNA transformation protein